MEYQNKYIFNSIKSRLKYKNFRRLILYSIRRSSRTIPFHSVLDSSLNCSDVHAVSIPTRQALLQDSSLNSSHTLVAALCCVLSVIAYITTIQTAVKSFRMAISCMMGLLFRYFFRLRVKLKIR